VKILSLNINISYTQRSTGYTVHYLDHTNKTTKSVYTDFTTNWSLTMGMVQHKAGSSRSLTKRTIEGFPVVGRAPTDG